MILTRYLTISKFLDLLEHGLFVPKANLLNDPREGTYRPDIFDEDNDHEYHEYDEQSMSKIDWAREWLYVSCWHSAYSESYAMWKIYGMHNEAIAISVDSDSIYQAVERYGKSFALLRHVSYKYQVDYAKPLFKYSPINGNPLSKIDLCRDVFSGLFYKHVGYAYESEVRLVMFDYEARTELERNSKPGIYLPFDKSKIAEITISPLAQEWFTGVVLSILKRYGVAADIFGSILSVR